MKANCLTPARAMLPAASLLVITGFSTLSQPMTLTHCLVQSVDTTKMAITLKQWDSGASLVLYVTSSTRLFRNGVPAITSDLQTGDSAGGSAQKATGNKIEAVRIYARQAQS